MPATAQSDAPHLRPTLQHPALDLDAILDREVAVLGPGAVIAAVIGRARWLEHFPAWEPTSYHSMVGLG